MVVNIMKNKYFFDQDHDCHWYLVQANKREEWSKWLGLDPEDENSWEAPNFAEPLGTHVSFFTFENVERV